MLGGAVLVRTAPATEPVGALVAEAEPPGEVAVTVTAMSEPTSAVVSVYVAAPPIVVQAGPAVVDPAGQRSQLKPYVDGLSHMPVSGVSTSPAIRVPDGAAGATRLTGGWATVAVALLAAPGDPSGLAAVTTTRTVLPTSAAASVYVEPVAPGIEA